MTIRCFNIDYDASDEDLDFAEACKEAIVMPSEIEVEIDEEDMEDFNDDPDDYLANEISNQTGWLVNDFEYEEIG